jgi:hypothetical protein
MKKSEFQNTVKLSQNSTKITLKSQAQLSSRIYDSKIDFISMAGNSFLRVLAIGIFLMALIIVVFSYNSNLKPSIELLMQAIQGDFSLTSMYSLITICAVQERMRTDIDKFPDTFTIDVAQ